MLAVVNSDLRRQTLSFDRTIMSKPKLVPTVQRCQCRIFFVKDSFEKASAASARNWSGAGGGRQGLPHHHRHAGEDVQREGGHAARAGSGDCTHPDLRPLGLPRESHLCGAETSGRKGRLTEREMFK